MTLIGLVNAVIAALGALPTLQKWFDDFVSLYVQLKINEMRQENRDAIKKALASQDQRLIEDLISPSNSGRPSGSVNTHIVDHLPGVQDPNAK